MDIKEKRFILERIHFYGIYGYIYDSNGELSASVVGDLESDENILPSQSIVEKLCQLCQEREAPVLEEIETNLFFFAIQDKEACLYIFGPIAMEALSLKRMQEYRYTHNIKSRKFHIPVISINNILNCISLAAYLLTGSQYTEYELLQIFGENLSVQESELDIYEYSKDYEYIQRLQYKVEKQWLAEVANGTFRREEMELTGEKMSKLDQIGTLAKGNNLKQLEYMVITTICLASRAAIQGGLNPYEAYNLSELYYQRVAE